jgi:hypothetical protein
LVPNTAITVAEDQADRRTYRVSFDKIERKLGFVCSESLESGMREIIAAMKSGDIFGFTAPDFAAGQFHNQVAMRALHKASRSGLGQEIRPLPI